MLVHVEIPGMSLNLQDPLLRLTGIHPRQTGGPLFCQILTDFARGGRRANSTAGPARGIKLCVFYEWLIQYNIAITISLSDCHLHLYSEIIIRIID